MTHVDKSGDGVDKERVERPWSLIGYLADEGARGISSSVDGDDETRRGKRPEWWPCGEVE